MFGDLGSANAKSLSYLQEETQRGHFDAILHVGEFYYFANFESHCKSLFSSLNLVLGRRNFFFSLFQLRDGCGVISLTKLALSCAC